ncbi:ABC transporter substrate-binding protein [Actinomadura sp. HBU206391]|nr:ABC transporter substrate-binding protein [Actinomadura sp. HBU206391]
MTPGSSGTGPIKIAIVNAQSGLLSSLGKWEHKGAKLAVDEWNQAGGINGRKIQLDVFDDQGDPTVGTNIARKIASQKYIAMIGTAESAVTIAMAPTLRQAEIPNIASGQSPGLVAVKSPFLFLNGPTSTTYDETLAKYLVDDLPHHGAGQLRARRRADDRRLCRLDVLHVDRVALRGGHGAGHRGHRPHRAHHRTGAATAGEQGRHPDADRHDRLRHGPAGGGHSHLGGDRTGRRLSGEVRPAGLLRPADPDLRPGRSGHRRASGGAARVVPAAHQTRCRHAGGRDGPRGGHRRGHPCRAQ